MSHQWVTQAQNKSSILSASSVLQRKCNKCHEKDKLLQRSAVGSAPETLPPSVRNVLHSPGQPLDIATRAFTEPRFVHDFSHVPVHSKSPAGIQAKFTVNTPGDVYEQEADRIAHQVMAQPANTNVRSTSPSIQRFSGQTSEESNAAPASVDQALASPGRPLEPKVRRDMEQRFGHDFSRVRVHTGTAAEQSTRDVNAHAYTVGHDLVFNSGRFAPGTTEGRRLIAHELTHVVQQSHSDELRVGHINEKRVMPQFVPCEQASLSGQSCPPREKGEVAESKTEPMTLHGTTWLSENGYPVNGYLVVGFEVGSSAIKKNLKDLLKWKNLVNLMKSSNLQWKIQGISDCSGSKDLNEGIRKARAEAIYNLLPEDARKHVVSRESVPLYECIAGNQSRIGRTVNRSVLIEQAGRTVDIKPAEEKVIEVDRPKFVCGPDVTRQVANAVKLAQSIFKGWTRSQREDACDALVSLRSGYCSWDIMNLHNNDWINKNFQPTCATTGAKPACGESVQVGDDCYYAGSANYVIYGTMFKLCSDEDPDKFFSFSKSNMKSFIDLYKGSGVSGMRTPAANFKNALAWANAGYDGWPSGGSPPSGDRNNCIPLCPLPYLGDPFDIHWYPHHSTEVCTPSVKKAVRS